MAPRPAPAAERGGFGQELARAGVVKAERTRLSGGQAASALSRAWQERFGQPPSERTLSILVAHWAHETGRGESMLNYNFGGIKGSGPGGLSAVYKTREGFGENEVRVDDRFRAYESPTEGARDYVDLLARRYGDAVDNAAREDPAGFVRALKAKGYFSGEEGAYVKSVTSLSNQALAQGFDAIGASTSATETGATPLDPERFGARASGLASILVPLGNAALLSPQDTSVAQGWTEPLARGPRPTSEAPSAPAAWNALSFADEVSRAALLIAARYGGKDPEGQG
jgi:hypothetical protein